MLPREDGHDLPRELGIGRRQVERLAEQPQVHLLS